MLISLARMSWKWLALGSFSLLLGCAATGDRSKPITTVETSSPQAVAQANNSFPNATPSHVPLLNSTLPNTMPANITPPIEEKAQGDVAGSISAVLPAAYQSPVEVMPAPSPSPESTEPPILSTYPTPNADDPFAGQSELIKDRLICEVQARNPSLQAMQAAWQAAAERYPQVISLDDPMFAYMLGTAVIGPEGGWMVMASQKIPWVGKRQLRGSIARSEADAACQDAADVRLRLAEAAANALFDYYLVQRQKGINAANRELMTEFRAIAQTRYEANQVPQQDMLQADLELAELQSQLAGLIRMEKIAVARINTLLHRAADYPLPPAPLQIAQPGDLPPVELLRETALKKRPDLAAQAARIEAEEANVNLACKEFYPDLEIVGKYDAFMPADMRSQLGMNLNIPLWRQKRQAAWREAMAKLQQRRAEYADLADRTIRSAFGLRGTGRNPARY